MKKKCKSSIGLNAWHSKLTKIGAIAMVTLLTSVVSHAEEQNVFVKEANLPRDVKPSCVANVADWFADDIVRADGWVEPANGLAPIFSDFKKNTRCDFYKWGAQTFLWLTSGREMRMYLIVHQSFIMSQLNRMARETSFPLKELWPSVYVKQKRMKK